MKIRKWMSWFFILVMLLSVVSCGSQPTPPADTPPTDEPEAVETPAEEPDSAPSQEFSYWGEWKMTHGGHVFDMGYGVGDVPQDKVFGDDTQPMWMTLHPDGKADWGYNIFHFEGTWKVEDGILIVHSPEPIEQSFNGVIQDDGSIYDANLWDSHLITMERTPPAPSWKKYQEHLTAGHISDLEEQAANSLVDKTFALVEMQGEYVKDAASSIWMRFKEDKRIIAPQSGEELGVWGLDNEGIFVESEGSKMYLTLLENGAFEYTDTGMVFASEGTAFDILQSQPLTPAQEAYATYWTGSLLIGKDPNGVESTGKYVDLMDKSVDVMGKLDLDLKGDGVLRLDLVIPEEEPLLSESSPLFTAKVHVDGEQKIHFSEPTFMGNLYSGSFNGEFNLFMRIDMPEYSDGQGATSLSFMLDPVTKPGLRLSTRKAYIASDGVMGFLDPAYNTDNGSVWDGKYKGTAWIQEATGASSDIHDHWYDVEGVIEINTDDDLNLRYVEITEPKTDFALLSYYIKTDDRHFEVYMEVPEKSNFYGVQTQNMPAEPGTIADRYITEKDDLREFAAFFVPGGQDRFVLRHRVVDPSDPNNQYTVYYDMERIKE